MGEDKQSNKKDLDILRRDSSLEDEDFNLDHFSDEGDSLANSLAKKVGLLVFEIIKVVLVSLAIIIPIRLFLVQPFYVEGASMEPNFHDKEYLVVNEISYRFNEPQRGEVIIFKNPNNTNVYFIKRIIALPGEEVEIKEGLVFINGQRLEETYIKNPSSKSFPKTTLGSDEYFVLGDNRVNSYDSREIGPINKDLIIGKVWFRGWPLDRIDSFNIPVYKNN